MGENSGLLLDLNSWNASLAGYSSAISSGVVMPVALTLLALFMMLEMYNMTMRISMNGGNSNAFTVWQICMTLIKLLICKELVTYSTGLLNLIMVLTGSITAGIGDYIGSGQVTAALDVDALMAGLESSIGAQISTWAILHIVNVMIWVVGIVTSTIVAARFIELYVYNALAPLSIATFCSQEMHGIGLGFLKSYTAVALQGAVLYLVIGFYPALAASLGGGSGSMADQAWALLGRSGILLIAVMMSGKFTRAVTGAMA